MAGSGLPGGALAYTSGRAAGKAYVNPAVKSTVTSPVSLGDSLALERIYCWQSLIAMVTLEPGLGPSSVGGNICVD